MGIRAFAFFLLFLAWGRAQPATAGDASEMSAADVVGAYLQANGGRSAIEGVISLRMTGTLSREGEEGMRFQMIKKRPARMQLTHYQPGREWILTTNGKRVWQKVIREERTIGPVEVEGPEAEAFLETAVFDSILMRATNRPGSIRLVGEEAFQGFPCYVLEVEEGGATHRIYVESLKFRELRILSNPGKEEASEILYSEFQKIDPLWIPMRIEQKQAGGRLVIELDSVQLNIGVFDSFFEPELP